MYFFKYCICIEICNLLFKLNYNPDIFPCHVYVVIIKVNMIIILFNYLFILAFRLLLNGK